MGLGKTLLLCSELIFGKDICFIYSGADPGHVAEGRGGGKGYIQPIKCVLTVKWLWNKCGQNCSSNQRQYLDLLHPIWICAWYICQILCKEGDVLFNDTLNTFYLQLYSIRHMVKDHSDSKRGNLLPPHRLLIPIAARVLLYVLSHRQDNTYHILCYTRWGALAGMRNSSMGPPWRIDPMTHCTMSKHS